MSKFTQQIEAEQSRRNRSNSVNEADSKVQQKLDASLAKAKQHNILVNTDHVAMLAAQANKAIGGDGHNK